MRKIWRYSLVLSVGICALAKAGEPVKWTAAAPPPAGMIARSKPPAPPAASAASAEPARLPIADTQIRPAGHSEPLVLPPLSSALPPPTVTYVDFPRELDSARPMPSKAGKNESSAPPLIDIKPTVDQPEPMPAPRLIQPKPEGSGFVPDGDGMPIIDGSSPGCDCGGCGDGACCDGGCCADGCCGSMFGCPSNRFYIFGDFLLWWMNPSNYPALVTTSSNAIALGAPPPAGTGANGNAGTTTLIGNQGIPTVAFPGFRVMAGYWFDPDHDLGIEGGGLYLGRQTIRQTVNSDANGNPFLGRPVFRTDTRTQVAEIISSPGAFAGGALVDVTSELWGAELNLRHNCGCCDWFHLDALVGFRHLGLNESLTVSESFTALAGNGFGAPPGFAQTITDRFNTRDRFYGGQIGAAGEFRWRRFFVDLNAKVAFGVTDQTVIIDGDTVSNNPAAQPVQFFRGGLLAQQSNIGQYGRSVFSVVPEVGLNVGMNVTERVRLYAGYNFLYWSNVVRPGEQVDTRVNVTQLPNPPAGTVVVRDAPLFNFRSTDFWTHGLNVGLEYRY